MWPPPGACGFTSPPYYTAGDRSPQIGSLPGRRGRHAPLGTSVSAKGTAGPRVLTGSRRRAVTSAAMAENEVGGTGAVFGRGGGPRVAFPERGVVIGVRWSGAEGAGNQIVAAKL